MKRTLLIGLIAASVGAHAQTLTWFTNDASFYGQLLSEAAVAEGRIGNNATNGTHELDLYNTTGSLPTAQTAQGSWGNSGDLHEFSLSYDSGSNTLTFSQLGKTLTYQPVGTWNGVAIRTRAVQNSVDLRKTTLSGLDLDGTALPDVVADSATDPHILLLTNFDAMGDWTLTGQSSFEWSGTRPSNSSLAYQIKMVEAVPEPFTMALGALALAGAVARRRRNR